MSGNGGDNAHNNQFGGGERGPTGGVNGGPTGLGGSGQGGGWGWKYNPGTNQSYVDASGQPHIVINGGWSRVPAGNGRGGSGNTPGGGSGGNPGNGPGASFGPDGVFTANVDGFVYRVTLDGSGRATGVTKVSEPERTGQEKLQIAVANANHRKPEEMFPQLDRSKTEPMRQQRARQQAEEAWRGTPAKSGEYDINVDGFTYHVKVSPSGAAESVTLTHEPERTGAEKLKIAVANANHRRPEDMFPELDRSKGESGRQTRAKQQAVSQYLSNPENQARIQREEALRRQQETLRKQQEEEARQKEEANQRAEEALRKIEVARQATESRVRSAGVMPVRGFPAGDAVSLAPVRYSVAGTGSVTLDEPMSTEAWNTLRSARNALEAFFSTTRGGPVGAVISLLFHSAAAGEGSDQVPAHMFSSTMPADTLSLPDEKTLRAAAAQGGTVNLSVRGLLSVFDGAIVTQLVRLPAPAPVRIISATTDVQTGYYGFTVPAEEGVPAGSILVSPADVPGASGPTILTGPVPLPEVVAHTGGPVENVKGPVALPLPLPEDGGFRDAVLVFPADSGLKPVYVMYNTPRSLPGTVSGHGQPVNGNWLAGAGKGDGAVVPSQIADKLRGKSYSSFDAFRRAFWKAISDDPELSKQFDEYDLERMKLGYAPTVDFKDSAGKRIKFELHHRLPISKGGDVYNVDNLNTLTPKHHIEIHKGK